MLPYVKLCPSLFPRTFSLGGIRQVKAQSAKEKLTSLYLVPILLPDASLNA